MLNSLNDYIGQINIKNNLKVFINSAKIQRKKLDHIFLYGQSGMGKTTLAKLIAKELNTKIYLYYGNNFKKPSDLFSIFSKIKDKEILFIDEIHCLNSELEEYFFTILESQSLSITIGKEYNSKVVNIKLNNFTIIVATTEFHKINEQFFNRFPIFFALENYNKNDISKIISNCLKKLSISIDDDALNVFVEYTKENPRIANNLVKRIYDYYLVNNLNKITKNQLENIFIKLNISIDGINVVDKVYMNTLINGSQGIKTIQQLTNFPLNMILQKIEPHLLKNGYVLKTNKGRKLTEKGKLFLKIK